MVNKKKRNHPDVEEIIARPWCYYCERDFDDDRVLTQHQKAKHFKCDHCNRRLNTAGGLSVHLQQVHKATLTAVENAIEGRQNVDPEIFGMCGIPQELLDAHRQRILNEYFKQQADRRAQTGNPPPGQGQPNAKKQRTMETKEELKARAAEHRAKRAAEREAAAKEGKAVQKSSSTTPDLAQARPTPTASSVSRYHQNKRIPSLTNLTRTTWRRPLRPPTITLTTSDRSNSHCSPRRMQVFHCSLRTGLVSHHPSLSNNLDSGLRTCLRTRSLRRRLPPTLPRPTRCQSTLRWRRRCRA